MFCLANVFYPFLANLLFILKLYILAELLQKYLGSLKINLLIILCFGTKLGYKGLINAFILLNNLLSALINLKIINKKLQEDFILR